MSQQVEIPVDVVLLGPATEKMSSRMKFTPASMLSTFSKLHAHLIGAAAPMCVVKGCNHLISDSPQGQQGFTCFDHDPIHINQLLLKRSAHKEAKC